MRGFSLLVVLAAPVHATDFTWNPPPGTEGSWTDSEYWSPELVPTCRGGGVRRAAGRLPDRGRSGAAYSTGGYVARSLAFTALSV